MDGSVLTKSWTSPLSSVRTAGAGNQRAPLQPPRRGNATAGRTTAAKTGGHVGLVINSAGKQRTWTSGPSHRPWHGRNTGRRRTAILADRKTNCPRRAAESIHKWLPSDQIATGPTTPNGAEAGRNSSFPRPANAGAGPVIAATLTSPRWPPVRDHRGRIRPKRPVTVPSPFAPLPPPARLSPPGGSRLIGAGGLPGRRSRPGPRSAGVGTAAPSSPRTAPGSRTVLPVWTPAGWSACWPGWSSTTTSCSTTWASRPWRCAELIRISKGRAGLPATKTVHGHRTRPPCMCVAGLSRRPPTEDMPMWSLRPAPSSSGRPPCARRTPREIHSDHRIPLRGGELLDGFHVRDDRVVHRPGRRRCPPPSGGESGERTRPVPGGAPIVRYRRWL